MSGNTESEMLDYAVQHKLVDVLVEYKWGITLSKRQAELVRKVAYMEKKRMSVSGMTRWGKTQCVALGIALLIDFDIPVHVAFIGPKDEQAHILQDYMSNLITGDKTGSLLSKATITSKGDMRINKEASKKRMKFKTGAEYRVYTAEGTADRLMGFGADIVVKDEACLIKREVNGKIMRMLGDNPENGILIELYNPWDTDNVAFEHTLDPAYDITQVSWRDAVEEGRTTEEFVMQQKKDLTPLEFTVLYESKFPTQSEDSLFDVNWVKDAEQRKFGIEEEYQKLLATIADLESKRTQKKEVEFNQEMKPLKEELGKFTKIIACDPAELGKDETIIYWGIEKTNKREVIGYYSEAKSEPMKVVGKIIEIAETYIGNTVKGVIHIDRIGIGSGPLSRLKEVISEKKMTNIKVVGCHFGEAAMRNDIYQNKKAENYFRLAELFREGFISIPVVHKLRQQLTAEKWERTSSNRKKIIDPDKSPDWGDALVYFCWKDKNALVFGFG